MSNIPLFLAGCIPTRVALAAAAYHIDEKNLPYLGVALGLMGLSFLYLFFTHTRLQAPEARGVTWWSHLRLIHGMLYLTAAVYALRQERQAWIPLALDVLFGLAAFGQHHLRC